MNQSSSDAYSEYESFKSTIDNLKACALADKLNLSDSDIASYLNISEVVFDSYMESDKAPPEIFEALRQEYGRYMPFSYTTIIIEEELADPSDEEEME
jgi:hypothetical protein